MAPETPVPRPVTAADLALREPTLLHPDATVDDVRRLLARPKVHLALLVDDAGVLVAAVDTEDLPADARGDAPSAALGVPPARTVPPGLDGDEVRRRLRAQGVRRAAVVDDGGRLVGLVCLKRHGRGFCSDDQVAAYRRDRDHGSPPRAEGSDPAEA